MKSDHLLLIVRLSLALCCMVVAAGAQTRLYTLENDRLRLSLDDKAAVVHLSNKQSVSRHNYVSRPLPGFWSLIFRRGSSLENVIEPQMQSYRIEQDGQALRISAGKLRWRGEELEIRLNFTIRLAGDELIWQAKVENRSDAEVTEFFFPTIGGIARLGMEGVTDDLIWPQRAGGRFRDLKNQLRPQGNEPVNRVADQLMELTYPWQASMSWYEFTNGREGIYFGSHDPSFMTGSLRVKRSFDSHGEMSFGFVKYPFVAPGEIWESGLFVVSPHAGDWHVGADKYRRWAESWRRVPAKPAWVEKMKGMLLVILKQQYGDAMWRYDEIPALYREARENGLDTVALFGWTEGGHDNLYPEYKPDAMLGGGGALREGLRQVREAGGKTILYCQGHLVDVSSPYYRSIGERLVAKNIWGAPYFEQYSKFHESSLLSNFSRKLFAPICPANQEWVDRTVEIGKDLLGYGPTGVIFDQVGGMTPYLCFDPSHGHSKPSMAFPDGRRKQLTALRKELKRVAPDFGFMTEQATDLYTQYVDVHHGIGLGFTAGENAFPQMFRYTFPDVIMTTRQPVPRVEARQVNHAFAYGLRFELEVRYRADMETIRNNDKPHLKEYLRQVSALRDRYWDLIGSGRFVDDRGVESSNSAVTVTGFEHDGRRAVVVWNNTKQTQTVTLNAPGYGLVEARGVEGALPHSPLILKSQQIAVLTYGK